MNALGYALLAQESYTATPDIGAAVSSSRAICRQTDDGFCVTFRGSDNSASWATDFDLETVEGSVGTVHKGFWEAWQVIAAEVKKQCAASGAPIILCGHSLGAALAIVAAADFVVSGIPLKAVYAFEPPCVSPDTNIRDLIAKIAHWLYRNGSDPVPEVPPLWPQSGNLTLIGKAAGLIPSFADHEIPAVIASLEAIYAE